MFKKIILSIFLFSIFLIITGCSTNKHRIPPLSYTPRALSYYYYLKFLELERKGDKEAVTYLKKAIDSYPAPDLFLEFGKYYLKKKKNKQAEEFIKKGLQKFPGEKKLTFFLYQLYILKNQKKNALALLQVYLKKNPKDREALKRLALLYFDKKDYEKAIDILKRIRNKDATVHYFLAQCYIKLKNINLAIFHLKKTVEIKPKFLKAWIELGYQLELIKDYAGAEDAYYYLFKKGLDNNEIRFKLIELNIKLNNLEKAYSLIEGSKKDPKFLFKCAVLFVYEGFYEYGERIINLYQHPLPPKLVYLKAYIIYKKHKKLKDALDLLKKIPENSPTYKDALSLMCRLYYESKQKSIAINIAKKGQNLFNDEEFWILEEEIWFSEKKYKKALEVLEKGLKKFPKSTDLLYQKGIVKFKEKKVDEALNIMEEVLKINPNHADALNFIGYTLADIGKDLDKALKLINQALQLEPNNGYYLDSLAWVYFRKKDYKKAWEIIKKAIVHVKDDPIIWEHYGDIASVVGETSEAIKGYKKALKYKPENPSNIRKKLRKILKK